MFVEPNTFCFARRKRMSVSVTSEGASDATVEQFKVTESYRTHTHTHCHRYNGQCHLVYSPLAI